MPPRITTPEAETRPPRSSRGWRDRLDPRIAVVALGVIAVVWSLRHGNPGSSGNAAVLAHAGAALIVVLATLLALRGLAELTGRRSADAPARPGATFTRAEKLAVFAGALALQFLVLYFAFFTMGRGASLSAFWDLFQERFSTAGDNPHYLYLAEYGYQDSGEKANLIVFFPLYPAAIWAVQPLFGSYIAAGMAVSWLCWGAACVTVLELAARRYDRSRALLAVGLLALYPFSFFSMGIYTESLFLLVSAQCLLRLERGQWRTAGVTGALAALCRTQGMLLFLPAIYLWLLARRQRASVSGGAFLLLIPGGFAGYLLLNQIVAGDWNAYVGFQKAAPWYQSVHWISDNLIQHYGQANAYPGLAPLIYVPQIILFFLVLAALYYGFVSGAPTYLLLYGGAYLGMTYLSGWMISGPRYVFGCLPLFLLAARPTNRIWQIALPVTSAVMLTSYATLYLQAQSIF